MVVGGVVALTGKSFQNIANEVTMEHVENPTTVQMQ